MTNIEQALKEKLIFKKKCLNNEMIFRCPFCNDSENPRKAHLYVNLVTNVFNCFRCGESGALGKLLNFLDIRIDEKALNEYIAKDKSLYKDIEEEGEDISGFREEVLFPTVYEIFYEKMKIRNKYRFLFDLKGGSKKRKRKFDEKINYLSKRIGKEKIDYFFELNKKQELMSFDNEFILDRLDKCFSEYYYNNLKISAYLRKNDFIVFFGNKKILNIFRFLKEDSGIRYLKLRYNFFGFEFLRGIENEKSLDYFLIYNSEKYKNFYDLYNENFLNVYLAEGVFDVINLYLYNPGYITSVVPDLVIAAGSKVSYISCMKYFSEMFLKKINFYLFLDSDFNENDLENFHKKFNAFLKYFDISCLFFKNKKFKDYGNLSEDDLKNIDIWGVHCG